MTWHAIAGFRLVAADPERLARFYAALGFAVGVPARLAAADAARLGVGGGVRLPMRLGTVAVDLDRYDTAGAPYPAAADAASCCFQHLAIVADDIAAAWASALAAGATPISRAGPVTLPAASGGVAAVKFRDPDGHPLEFLRFPDMDAAGWPGRGILGIDHSAITVADADAARTFYRGHGLVAGAPTLNRGAEQAALDGLEDPEALVVPLHAPGTRPHLELLGYCRPPVTADPPAVNDIAATRIVWAADATALVSDPDGHLHEAVVMR